MKYNEFIYDYHVFGESVLQLHFKREYCVHFTSGQMLVVIPLQQQCGEDEKHTVVWQQSGCDKDIGIEHICGWSEIFPA